MDYVSELCKRMDDVYKKIAEAKNQVTVGASKGVMLSPNSVMIGGQTCNAYLACDIPSPVEGTPVWCQFAGKNSAVVVGIAV